MGFIIGVIVLLVAASLLTGSLKKASVQTPRTKVLRPYLGLFAIAGLVAVASYAVGALFDQVGAWMLLLAKVIAVIACVSLCVHLAVIVAKNMLGRDR